MNETRWSSRLWLLAVLGLAVACDAAIEQTRSEIIGGVVDEGHPSVVMLSVGCTGTLIGDRTVLTAAHCVDSAVASGRDDRHVVTFGTSRSDPDAINIGTRRMVYHRRYAGGHDIAMVLLDEDRPSHIEPMPFNMAPLTSSIVGEQILFVGFGNNDGVAGTGFGTKRRVNSTVHSLAADRVRHGDASGNVCQGDSGGPGILVLDFAETVIGVNSFGDTGCTGSSSMMRVDAFVDDFVVPIYDAWEGPCRQDGVCVTDCPRTPDPDCDPCGFEGTCATDCPQVDLDCPLVGLAGARCEVADDCESRLCVPAPEDPRVKFCSAVCDPSAATALQCEAPLVRCEPDSEGDHLCYYRGLTPGTQGASCSADDDCRSAICDSSDSICVEPCGDGLAECPEEFVCDKVGGVSACRLPDSGGCRAGGRFHASRWPVGILALVGVFAMARRTRRRRV